MRVPPTINFYHGKRRGRISFPLKKKGKSLSGVMFHNSCNRKFLIIFVLTSLWFILAFLLSSSVFHAGIYSCRDEVFLQCAGRHCSALETTDILKRCRASQNIGDMIFLFHFLPAIGMGLLIGQLTFHLIPHLDGIRFGTMIYFSGFIPTVFLEILLISRWLCFRSQHKHN